MKNLKFLILPMMAFAMVSCGNDKPADASASTSSTETSATTTETSASSESGQYDPKRGLGKYDESNVDVSKFDAAMAAEGKKISRTRMERSDYKTNSTLDYELHQQSRSYD